MQNELTKAEEQIMQILWDKEKAFVKDIIDEIPKPKPAYNTVSTIIRTLERKKFVGHKSYGNSHQYFPTVNKAEYTKFFMKRVISNYFDNSLQQMVSFFSKDKDMTINEVDEAIKFMQQIKKQKKS
ncbi:MAG: BlaI/MecI/CopY family transcriptional regulator [bacterium]|nr:BlaI/MecI/CopY family transcriptional regulator [bacterium]